MEAGLSVVQLARLIGVTDAAVSQYELEIREPKVSILVKLANILGVTMDSLVEERASPEGQGGPGQQEGGALQCQD